MTDESAQNPAESASSEAGAPPPPPPAGTPPPPPSGGAPNPPGGSSAGSPPPTGGVSENRTIFLVLAYLGPLALIPFLLEKEDGEVQWHSKHGLVIFLAEIILGIVITIGNLVLGTLLPIIGTCIGCIVPVILGIGLLIFHIMCIMKALEGKRLLVPGVSEFADRF